MKPNVAIIAGGNSSEIVISVQSGENIFKAIDLDLFTPWLVHIQGDNWGVYDKNIEIAKIDKSDFSFSFEGEKVQIENDDCFSPFTYPDLSALEFKV